MRTSLSPIGFVALIAALTVVLGTTAEEAEALPTSGPDLAVSYITSPSGGKPGESIYFTFKVTNIGDAKAEGFSYEFFMRDTWSRRIDLDSGWVSYGLESFEAHEVSGYFELPRNLEPGYGRLVARIDPEGSDVSDWNNSLEESFEILDINPELRAGDLTLSPYAARPGEGFYASFYVENKGEGASDGFSYRISLNGDTLESGWNAGLEPNGWTRLSIHCWLSNYATPGRYTVTVYVQDYNTSQGASDSEPFEVLEDDDP